MEQNHSWELYVLLTGHLITLYVNDQLDAQFFFVYLCITVLYMFRATKCSSSGQSTVSIRPLVYVTVCRWPCGYNKNVAVRILQSAARLWWYETVRYHSLRFVRVFGFYSNLLHTSSYWSVGKWRKCVNNWIKVDQLDDTCFIIYCSTCFRR